MKKDCVVCGAEFDALGKVITCSVECASVRKREAKRLEKARYRERYPEKIRAQKAAYRARKSGRQEPDRAEREAHRRAKLAALDEQKTRECIVCGTEFEARNNVKTCSEECWMDRRRDVRRRPERNFVPSEFKEKKRAAQNARNARLRAAYQFVREIEEKGLEAIL